MSSNHSNSSYASKELVAAVERRHEFGGLPLGERFDRAERGVLPDDAIDAAVGLVTQVVLRLVSAAAPGRPACPCRWSC